MLHPLPADVSEVPYSSFLQWDDSNNIPTTLSVIHFNTSLPSSTNATLSLLNKGCEVASEKLGDSDLVAIPGYKKPDINTTSLLEVGTSKKRSASSSVGGYIYSAKRQALLIAKGFKCICTNQTCVRDFDFVGDIAM